MALFCGAMRTFTLVTDALVPAGRAKAAAAAARGKDLVLVGEMRSLLEELASELRVLHRVDVRVLPVDLAEPDGAEQVLAWLDDRTIVLDGLVLVHWTDTDEARASQLAVQLERLERALTPKLQQRGFGPPVRVVQERRASGTFAAPGPSRPPPAPGSNDGAAPPASRGRASTRPGHADPSERPRSFTPVP